MNLSILASLHFSFLQSWVLHIPTSICKISMEFHQHCSMNFSQCVLCNFAYNTHFLKILCILIFYMLLYAFIYTLDASICICVHITWLKKTALQNSEKHTFPKSAVFQFSYWFTSCKLGSSTFICELHHIPPPSGLWARDHLQPNFTSPSRSLPVHQRVAEKDRGFDAMESVQL